MKLTAEPSVLLKALKSLQPAIQSSPAIPIMENIKWEVSSGLAKLTGSNTNLTISNQISCHSKEDGVFLLPFKRLYSIVSLAQLPIEITIGKEISVKIGKEYFSFGTPVDVINYPTLKEGEYVDTFPVDSDFISNLQSASKFTVATKTGIDGVENVCIDLLGNKVCIVSTNRTCLYLFESTVQTKTTGKYLPDVSFINAIPLIENGEISLSDRVIKFQSDTLTVTSTLSEQKFVDYTFPFKLKLPQYNCIINRKELIESLNMISALKIISNTTEMSFSKGNVSLYFDEREWNSEYKNSIQSSHSVDDGCKFHFNAQTLRSILQEMSADEDIFITYTNEKSLVYFDSEDGKTKTFIVPQQINN